TVRAVFIVDDKGFIRLILYYPQEMGRNMDEILRVVEGLQFGGKHGVALPANWPKNDIIDDHVIIPPVTTVDAANERKEKTAKGEMQCFDWWFCHKKV
ncbi:MAG TPA: peroxiredoxin, partial [Candidatus Cloacimonadota bacterium]|nr:peroxiredoxin [Candidatus Cloacimonadota bacterium]